MQLDPFIVAGILGGGTYVIRLLLRRDREQADELSHVWDTAARRFSGTVEGSTARYGRRTLRAEVAGAALVLTADTARQGKGTRMFTRLRAGPLLGLVDADVQIARRGILGTIARKLHLREVTTGDTTFDGTFRVTGTSAIIRELLDARTRRRFCDTGEGLLVSIREIEMEREGHPEDVESIAAIVRHAEMFVRRWNELAVAPSRFAEALDLAPLADAVPLRERGSAVVARGLRRGREITMSVRLDDTCTTLLAFEAGSVVEVALPGLSPDPREALGSLDAALDAAPTVGLYR